VVDERRDHLRVARQPPDLLLRLPTRVVVRHQELDQQQLQRLRHFSRLLLLLMLLPAAWSLTFAAIGGAGGGGGGGLGESKNPIDLEARSLGLWWRRALGGGGRGLVGQLGNFCLFVFCFLALFILFSF